MLFEHEIDKKMDHDFPKVRLKVKGRLEFFPKIHLCWWRHTSLMLLKEERERAKYKCLQKSTQGSM